MVGRSSLPLLLVSIVFLAWLVFLCYVAFG
jgi:hypothetical protein